MADLRGLADLGCGFCCNGEILFGRRFARRTSPSTAPARPRPLPSLCKRDLLRAAGPSLAIKVPRPFTTAYLAQLVQPRAPPLPPFGPTPRTGGSAMPPRMQPPISSQLHLLLGPSPGPLGSWRTPELVVLDPLNVEQFVLAGWLENQAFLSGLIF